MIPLEAANCLKKGENKHMHRITRPYPEKRISPITQRIHIRSASTELPFRFLNIPHPTTQEKKISPTDSDKGQLRYTWKKRSLLPRSKKSQLNRNFASEWEEKRSEMTIEHELETQKIKLWWEKDVVPRNVHPLLGNCHFLVEFLWFVVNYL